MNAEMHEMFVISELINASKVHENMFKLTSLSQPNNLEYPVQRKVIDMH